MLVIENGQMVFNAISKPQLDFYYCDAKFPGFAGGFGSGKSHVGSAKFISAMLFKFPGHNGLAIAPTYGDLSTIVAPELMTRLGELGIKAKYHASSPMHISFNASIDGVSQERIIFCRSAEKASSIMGFEVGVIYADEAARIKTSSNPLKDAKTQALARLRGPGLAALGGGQYIQVSTHESQSTGFAVDYEIEPKPGHVLHRSSTYDNPFMQEYADELTRQYPEKLLDQYVKGHIVNLSDSLVYFNFSPADWPNGNVDKDIYMEKYLPYCLTLDFNASPGLHAVLGQYRRDLDEFWAVDEFHRPGMNIPGLVEAYNQRYGQGDKKPMTTIFGDATGRARDVSLGETAYNWLKKCFQEKHLVTAMQVANSNPLQEDRFISANAAFLSGGKRHVRIHPRCKKLIRDLGTVDRDETGRLNKKLERQGWVHMSDAFTYWLHRERPVNKTTVSGFLARKVG